ncbi:hypothetical protein PV392_27605 [Streptomyces sp. ME03-5709C]|nr:hypothetical protein [Streptomyces sp. ME03-5709C]
MTTTEPGADELRVRGILRRRGVGPDALAIPPRPTRPPHAPAQAVEEPAGGGRLPDWRKGHTIDLTAPAEEEPAGDDAPDTGLDNPDTDADSPDTPKKDTEEDADDAEPDTGRTGKARPRGAGPALLQGVDKLAGVGRATAVRSRHVRTFSSDRRLRAIAFNGTAAAVGYAGGLVGTLGAFLPVADHAATGMASILLAAGAAYGTWQFTGHRAVVAVLPHPWISRVLLTAGAAEIGRRLAPQPVAWLDQHGAAWGLGPGTVSLLITAGAMCGGLWWLLDRRARRWHWAARWFARIPLASALLAAALYAPGPTL